MSRVDFMKELESLLLDIPLEEREEALQYYTDYFEDAGEDHEEEIIKELGSPKRVAEIIKADLSANSSERENRGYFTEKGYQDTLYQEDKFEIVKAGEKGSKEHESKEKAFNGSQSQEEGNKQKRYTSNTNIGLIILLCIFAIPIGLPLFFSVFGVVVSVIATIVALLFSFGIAGLAMIGAGIALFIVGIIQIGVPFAGIVLCGAGLLVFGLGMMFVLASALLCKKILPAIIKGIIELCRLPFKNRSVMA